MTDSGEDLQAVHAKVMESVLGGSVALAVAAVPAMADKREVMADLRDALQSIDAKVTDYIVRGVMALSLAALAEEGQKKKAMQCRTKQCIDYLTENLKAEVDECSPRSADLNADASCISESGVQRLEVICKNLFAKSKQFVKVYQLNQFAS